MRIIMVVVFGLSLCVGFTQNKWHPHPSLLHPAYVQPVFDVPQGTINEENQRGLEPFTTNFLNVETTVGNTIYDLQSNAAMQNRLVIGPDGRMAAVWMQTQERNMIYSDRGTGYNYFDGTSWQEIPTQRLESERVGWPSISLLDDASVHIVTHTSNNELHTIKMKLDGSDITESKIPDNTPNGLLWPRSAAAGQTVHVIGLTTPSGQMGAPYQGLDGNLLYYRSSDAGTSWEIVDFEIPGLDTSFYRFITADTYTIEASGDIVAIVIFSSWGDVLLLKSFDRGDSWETRIINDFPLDGYNIDDGYTIDDIPDDPLAPNELAIYTSNGSGEALIDAQGIVHVTYADGYVLDEMSGDSVSSFFPGWAGISYWNETMVTPVFAGGIADLDGNDTLDIDLGATPRYGGNTITSMPTLATNNDGEIIIIYSMVSEANFNELDEQHYRHLVAVKSLDNGASWGPIFDLINPDFVDPDFYEFVEAVYPSAHPFYDDTLHLIYQQDFFPGHTFDDDENDPQADNFISHMAVPVDAIPDITSVSTEDPLRFLNIQLYPTLVENMLTLSFDPTQGEKLELQVLDLMGHRLLLKSSIQQPSEIDLSNLAPGPYFVQILTPNASTVYKILKQ